jgi:hypothetical protein
VLLRTAARDGAEGSADYAWKPALIWCVATRASPRAVAAVPVFTLMRPRRRAANAGGTLEAYEVVFVDGDDDAAGAKKVLGALRDAVRGEVRVASAAGAWRVSWHAAGCDIGALRTIRRNRARPGVA